MVKGYGRGKFKSEKQRKAVMAKLNKGNPKKKKPKKVTKKYTPRKEKSKETIIKKELRKYPQTSKFKVIDTIGVPHPYCVTPKHLEFSEGMYLDIEGAEKRSREQYPNDPRKWAVCDICRRRERETGEKILTYKEHKQALLIEVDGELKDKKTNEVLKEYLLKIKPRAEREGFAGFAFVRKNKE